MRKNLIGLTGYAQTGKDTVGQILVKNHGFTRLSFADNVRKAVLRLDPWINETPQHWRDREGDFSRTEPMIQRLSKWVDVYGYEYCKTQFPEVRRLLQVMGTEVGREMFGQQSWVEMVAREVEKYDNVVITDVRFPNEANFIRWNGGIIVKVIRDGVGPVNDHASEALDFEVQGFIENNGTLDDLVQAVDGLNSSLCSL